MLLNLPIYLDQSQNILLASVGGGFDVFNSMAMTHTLSCLNKNWHISSYSVDSTFRAGEFVPITEFGPNDTYNPEGILANWINKRPGYGLYGHGYGSEGKLPERPIWKIGKVGPRPLAEAYKKLISKLNIDTIIMMDGGVDSLMIGNETRKGTVTEEYINFAALADNPIKKHLMSFGFGCEVEEEISHYRVLENMASLLANNKFEGTCALNRDLADFANYNCAYQHVVERYPNHKKSHIHPRIIRAIQGEFGYKNIEGETIMKSNKPVFISPLMAVMWWFNGDAVIAQNQLVPMLKNYTTFYEAVELVRMAPNTRDNQPIPY